MRIIPNLHASGIRSNLAILRRKLFLRRIIKALVAHDNKTADNSKRRSDHSQSPGFASDIPIASNEIGNVFSNYFSQIGEYHVFVLSPSFNRPSLARVKTFCITRKNRGTRKYYLPIVIVCRIRMLKELNSIIKGYHFNYHDGLAYRFRTGDRRY